jgi:hypothetical protein
MAHLPVYFDDLLTGEHLKDNNRSGDSYYVCTNARGTNTAGNATCLDSTPR